jgi:Acyl-CoA dehydrogenase, C-terminal domain
MKLGSTKKEASAQSKSSGMSAMALWVALLPDTTHRADDPAKAKQAGVLTSLLTPVVKAFFTDRSFESANLAVQIHGGHGYIRDNGVEQHVRDARIFQLYEGANGRQALDLVMRKLPAEGGRAFATLIERIETFLTKKWRSRGYCGAGDGNREFLQHKLILGNFWAEREMPLTQSLLTSARSGASTLMVLPAAAF